MKSRSSSIWPTLYVVLGIAAAVAPRTLAGFGRDARFAPLSDWFMVFVAMPLLSVFTGVTSYFSLVRRSTPNHLREHIWNSPPTNPQSNQLAQIIGFGCLSVSAVSQHADGVLRMLGIFGLWISLALIISLRVFRVRHVRKAA